MLKWCLSRLSRITDVYGIKTTSRGEFTFLNDSPLSNQYVVTNTTRCEHCTMAYCNVITDINLVGVWWLEFYVGNDYGAVLNISIFSNRHFVSVASENSIVPNLWSVINKCYKQSQERSISRNRDQSTFITDDLLLIETSPITAALGATKTSLSMDVLWLIA